MRHLPRRAVGADHDDIAVHNIEKRSRQTGRRAGYCPRRRADGRSRSRAGGRARGRSGSWRWMLRMRFVPPRGYLHRLGTGMNGGKHPGKGRPDLAPARDEDVLAITCESVARVSRRLQNKMSNVTRLDLPRQLTQLVQLDGVELRYDSSAQVRN